MLKVKNLYKFYNKNKRNEIIAINNTSIEFPETGLVCLLGPSGSGKTTLLNVIGGLEKLNSGEVEFKDYKLVKYQASKWDVIRNSHFGYIFQNYYLIPDLTVYQNLELVLKILGLKKAEIEERIDYVLDAVGMLKYKNRKPTELSGGQQQRVAIARALVKSPDVVIADEPTGNLDQKNTMQIMNVIKKISKECLVILVTHEVRLAHTYADRIIEVLDGEIIKDEINTNNNILELHDDNIYLKELNQEEHIKNNLEINYFYQDKKQKLALNVVFEDNTFYIQSPIENVKIRYIDEKSDLKVLDQTRPKFDLKDLEEFDYNLPKIENKSFRNKSIISFKDTIKLAFNQLNGLRRRQKLMFVVLFLASIIITFGFINFFTSRNINEDDFFYFNRNIVIVEEGYYTVNNELNDREVLIMHPELTIVSNFGNAYYRGLSNNLYVRNDKGRHFMSVMPVEILDNPKIYKNYGRLIEKPNEALIDKLLVDKLLNHPLMQSIGIKHPEQLLGFTFQLDEEEKFSYYTYEIVGIVNNNNPNLYINFNSYKNSLISINSKDIFMESKILSIDELIDSEYFEVNDDIINLEKKPISLLELGPNQVIINSYFDYHVTKGKYKKELNGLNFEIVGVVNNLGFEKEDQLVYVSSEFTNDRFEKSFNKGDKYQYVYTPNPTELINRLAEKNIKAETYYNFEIKRLDVLTLDYRLFIASLVMLIASLVFLYFLMRSSLMSRIYEVGVYRALGINKLSIYKIFFSEILIITLLTVFLGIVSLSLFINQVNNYYELIYYPFYIPPLSLLFILVVNTVVGLLPVVNLLRLTPAQILSKYDI